MTTTTTTDAAPFREAIAAVGLPDWIAWDVTASARRRKVSATIEPGGAVRFAVPAGGDPERVADAVRRMRGRLIVAAEDKRDRGVRIIPKQLVNGEGFPFVGRNHRLRLVVDGDELPTRTAAGALTAHQGVPIIAEPGPSTWSGVRTWQLTMRRDAASARTVIEWYRAHGQEWLDQNAPDMLRRLGVPADKWPTWQVRPYREGDGYGGTWGTYLPRPHMIRIDWLVFQFPPELARYVLAHEVAHAALRGQHAGHGRRWELVVSRLCPEWRELDPRAKELPGLPLWVGEIDPAGEPVAQVEPEPVAVTPFVSGWAGLA